MSVRDTERLVRRMLGSESKKKSASRQPAANSDVRRLEVEITEKLGAKTQIDHRARGSGRILIEYNSLDELDGILKHIR
jgi:ParB family chromosome partitioning protein